MAEWFHRNYPKYTNNETFELSGVALITNEAAQKICSELRLFRSKLIGSLANPSLQTDDVLAMLNTYLALLHGFVVSPEEEGGGDSKLRHAITFCWSSTLCYCASQSDAVFEKISMLFNVSLWLMNHASFLASQDDGNMDDQGSLEVHKCLRVASGMFTLIKRELIDQLKEPTQRTTDLDPNILDGYIHQCTAEAQEVTVGRAIELKHDSAIVSSLAHETAKVYRLADAALTAVFGWTGHKWQRYLQFKAEIYFAYAYTYRAAILMAQDKCGDAIRCLQESQSHYELATKAANQYSQSWDVGTAKPQDNLFFRRLALFIRNMLEKYEYENGFIYRIFKIAPDQGTAKEESLNLVMKGGRGVGFFKHYLPNRAPEADGTSYLQKVPMAVPSLGEKATFGVATPEEFQMPPRHPLWTVDAYRAFDVKKLPGKYNKLLTSPAPVRAVPAAAPTPTTAPGPTPAPAAPAGGGVNVGPASTPVKDISQPANDPTTENNGCTLS